MTKEALEARIKELEAQKEQAIATVNAIAGALQDCNFWLAKVNEPAPKECLELVKND